MRVTGLVLKVWLLLLTLLLAFVQIALVTGERLDSAGTLAFVSDLAGDDDIYLMDASRQTTLPLVRRPGRDWSPSWSPDGLRFVYVSEGDLYIMTLQGRTVQQLTHDATNAWPAWSPDGRWIAYSSNREGSYDLLLMDTATGDVQRMTRDYGSSIRPTWSPDSRALLYHKMMLGLNRLDITTGDIHMVTPSSEGDSWAAWSPDGLRIVAAAFTNGTRELYVMDADGAHRQRLTRNAVDDGVPTWTPRGDQIVYYAGAPGSFDLYMMNADGSNPRRLTTFSGNEMFPVLQP